MISKNDLARAVEEITGVKPTLVKNVMDAMAQVASEELADGEDFTVPGIARISWSYTQPKAKGESYKKGDTYIGFGGVEQVAEEASQERKASVKLRATPAAPLGRLAPKRSDKAAVRKFLSTKAGKNIVARKGRKG